MRKKFLTRISRVMTLLCLMGLSFYRVTLSWFFGGSCRFHPTCSVYAEQAFKSYGPLKALSLVLLRLARCHPFGGFGEDPLPQKNGNKNKGFQNV